MSDLNARLLQLSKLGKPRISLVGLDTMGWHASIDLPAPAGCKAQVASDFQASTPEQALDQLEQRLEALRGASIPEQIDNPRLTAA